MSYTNNAEPSMDEWLGMPVETRLSYASSIRRGFTGVKFCDDTGRDMFLSEGGKPENFVGRVGFTPGNMDNDWNDEDEE